MIGQAAVFVWGGVTGVAAVASLPGSVELLGLSLGALPRPKSMGGAAGRPWSVAVVVPAHNEALSIAGCVGSLLSADRGELKLAVFVVADNCSDETAEVARAAGATVLERVDPARRGKGFALNYAFTHELVREYDCCLVVDADTSVAANFVLSAGRALRDGADAVQARYVARNAEDTTRTRLMALALRAFNVVRPRGRQNLGLSVGILGNGFGLRRETLLAVPYLAASVVEDLEYHHSLVRAGKRVQFLDRTTVFGEMPVKGKGAETQRSRWEGGRLRMVRESVPGLLRDVLRGRVRCAEPLLELLLLPLAFHVLLLVVACCAPWWGVRIVGLAGVAIVMLHMVAAIVVGDGGWSDVKALATAPLYVLWKVMMIPKVLRGARKEQEWVRTERNSE